MIRGAGQGVTLEGSRRSQLTRNRGIIGETERNPRTRNGLVACARGGWRVQRKREIAWNGPGATKFAPVGDFEGAAVGIGS
jgi:hypothetical protein